MRKMTGLIKRNLLVYFKDKSAILFSMITPIILLVLYMLFLRGTYVDAINRAAESLKDFLNLKDMDALANGILLAGVMSSAMITVPYNTLSTIVYDREAKVDYDISATPIKRYQIIMAYYLSSSISAFIMTSAILTGGLILIGLNSSMYISGKSLVLLYGVTLLGSVSGTAFFMPVMVLIKKASAVGAFMGIVSAAAGFVIGAYIPLSDFSKGVQVFCNLFPATGITVILRNLLMNGVLDHIDRGLGGIDQGIFVREIKSGFGFSGNLLGNEVSLTAVSGYIVMVTIVLIFIIAALYSKFYKKK